MKEMKRWIYLFFALISHEVLAQEPPKNLVYANDNLAFEELMALGEHKLLYIADYKNEDRRFLYLLNKQNLVTDTMKVLGNDYFLLLNDSTFHLRGLGEYVRIRLSNDRFNAQLGFSTKARFTSKVIDPIFMFNHKFFGRLYSSEEDCLSYHYLDVKAARTTAFLEVKNEDYNFNQLDTVLVFDDQTVFFKNNKPVSHKEFMGTILDLSEVCDKRLSYPYYSWNSYSLSDRTFFMYEKSQATLFGFDVDQDFKVLHKVEFPVQDKSIEGWKYLFDHDQKKHYAVKRVEQVDRSTDNKRKRRRRKEPVNYSYTLYEVQPDSGSMKAIVKLGFDPKMIHEDLIYEVVTDEKTTTAIYFHPLDPNYQYPKITYLDY